MCINLPQIWAAWDLSRTIKRFVSQCINQYEHVGRGAGNRCQKVFLRVLASVYSTKQTRPQAVALKESDAYPALPEDGYGWEKLFSERMCRHFEEEFDLICPVAAIKCLWPARYLDRWPRKAPTGFCRKVIEAKKSGIHEINIWEMESRRAVLCLLTTAYAARR